MSKKPDFSLVIPAYNEAERLPATLPRMVSYLDGLPGVSYEIVVVDDGSADETAARAEAELNGSPGRVISYRPNRGKGCAVKRGMLASEGRIRLFSDADLSTPLTEIPRFLAAHRRGYDVVIGSRKRPGARVVRRQPLLRESMGKVFTLLSNVLVVSGVSDFTCGFKSFTAEASERVFPRMEIEDWSYDTELLWLVRDEGLRLKEVPVSWEDDPRTKVSRVKDTVRSLKGLLRMARRRHRL
jgi:glycosyltransferase involved in cell wall biosynthesis